MYSGIPPYGHLVNTVTWLLQYGQWFLFPLIRPPCQHDQQPHSEIPNCIILYNVTLLTQQLEPAMLMFPLTLMYVLIKVSTTLKILPAF